MSRSGLRRAIVTGGLIAFAAVACSAPEFKFASSSSSSSGDSSMQERDSGSVENDSGTSGGEPSDAAGDANIASDARALMATAMANTGDLNADCTSFNEDMNAAVIQGMNGPSCIMFFHSATWKRTWPEAKAMCGQITRGAKTGHLAIFADPFKAPKLVESKQFPNGLATWIGLELTGGSATDKGSFTWVDGTSAAAFDGWASGHPSGKACVSWAGTNPLTAEWIDVDCPTLKGILCEMAP